MKHFIRRKKLKFNNAFNKQMLIDLNNFHENELFY